MQAACPQESGFLMRHEPRNAHLEHHPYAASNITRLQVRGFQAPSTQGRAVVVVVVQLVEQVVWCLTYRDLLSQRRRGVGSQGTAD